MSIHSRALALVGAAGALPKQARWLAWTHEDLLAPCDFCGVGLSNVLFSPLFRFHDRILFTCGRCQPPRTFQPVFARSIRANRLKVWLHRVGPLLTATCPCCMATPMRLMESGWHVSHVVARAEGGANAPHNLIPTCGDCNLRMRTATITPAHTPAFRSTVEVSSLLRLLRRPKTDKPPSCVHY